MSTSTPQLSIQTFLNPFDVYTDARSHGYQGPTRNVRLPRATPSGGGTIAKNEDGTRCAVAGKESLRILRFSEPGQTHGPDHKSTTGRGGHRIDASRNFWEGSGLKIDSASTDIAWGSGLFSNKILTSARNGELIMWDLHQSGTTKYERRIKDHTRAINQVSVSKIVQHYCITGSADGDLRAWILLDKTSIEHNLQSLCSIKIVLSGIICSRIFQTPAYDLRDLTKSVARVHHPTGVRSVVFSPSFSQPVHAMVGLDNGTIFRWDLRMARARPDRISVAHTASVMSLDWCTSLRASTLSSGTAIPNSGIGFGGGFPGGGENSGGVGWLVSGGLDRCVKVWDLSSAAAVAHMPQKPMYTLHTSFPVRKVLWRPSYDCELAVVSNAEFSAPPNVSSSASSIFGADSTTQTISTGLLTRVSSGLGLEGMMRAVGASAGAGIIGGDMHQKEKIAATPAVPSTEVKNYIPYSGGDAVEIWDVRRGWIAKWSVTGSGNEGGVTDLAFNDAHAIWTQNMSGAFCQIDLRDATKPLDAIPRVATTWEPTGSLAFVSENKARWEVPFDDVKSEQQATAETLLKRPHKALGDPPAKPNTQNIGMFTMDYSAHELDVFTKLARGYLFEGKDRRELCAANAQVALNAREARAAHTWLLVGSSLAECLPKLPPTPPTTPPDDASRVQSPAIQRHHAISAPASFPSTSTTTPYTFPHRPVDAAHVQKISPGRGSVRSLEQVHNKIGHRSPSAPRSKDKMTPASSTSSSPRHVLPTLPPITPRKSSFFGRRESADSGLAPLSRRSSLYRRPSISIHGHHSTSASPIDKSAPSLRHVGEGALDDSDSESSSSRDEDGEQTAGPESSDGESVVPNVRPLVSPAIQATRAMSAAPSPLSRVAGQQQWTDDDREDRDDDDEDSASPRSTDTDSGGSSSPHRRAKSNRSRRSTGKIKSRSRSSTVASLAAPRLTHQDSRSSIRTVTAGEVSFHDEGNSGIKAEETVRDLRSGHARHKSQAISEAALHHEEHQEETDERLVIDPSKLSDRRIEIIKAEERKIREMCWSALRQALEDFADEGDIQMCAILSVITPEELHIPKWRVTRFLESYIDLLTRVKLYTSAAYLRKYCHDEEVRSASLMETTIYTSCGKCRKPLMKPAGTSTLQAAVRGGYAYCLACKSACVVCAICRLPVRALLFQCSVCNHGGHQACYRRYYMQQPMVELLPSSFLPSSNSSSRGRTTVRGPPTVVDDDASSVISERVDGRGNSNEQSPIERSVGDRLTGHPCAAGCGHFCWAANGNVEEL
ncbi:hypothetical protein BDQ12DRAFT_713152 [Crucibulum laeve]|uniref:Uncharacterized protein n=1 Tax=Crucibulum laeve TaxID=68775 RepID=A0A5C3M1D0_9AGAR|nr:hypothetical protein BDQ12DRAFT_713152 [Crucibulum laeve]